jgi:NAD(P)-dependent dehydrogenase (short-subunit alcohol dehydrogenase family)
LITGASSGIGRAAAEHLALRGFQVYAGARDHDALEELNRIPNTTALQLDVTKVAEIQAARRVIEAKGQGLFGLVNNAGIAEVGPLMEVETGALRAQFEVNLFGLHEVTRAFFPLLYKTQGRVVMISSDSGFLATPFAGPYCASKFALEGYSDSLRREIAHHGVRVILIEPGAILTDIWGKAQKGFNLAKYARSIFLAEVRAVGQRAIAKGQRNGLPPRAVAEVIHCALTAAKPRLRYLVAKNSLEYRLMKILPAGWVDRLIYGKMRRALRMARKSAAK